MNTPIDELIQKVSFPMEGQHFSVVYTRMPSDGSYKEDVFKCLASDASRVVAKMVTGGGFDKDHKFIFHRADWQFDDVSALIGALGLGETQQAE